MRSKFHRLRGFVRWPVLIVVALPNLGPGFGSLPAQSTSPGAREDARAALRDWSRGTTILIDGLRDYLRSYREALAQHLGVGVPELVEAIKKEPGKAEEQHRLILSDYEAVAEKTALASGVDPRSVNPRIRAKFGDLIVQSGDHTERLSDAVSRGRTIRDHVFDAAYQAASNGIEPLNDQKVQSVLTTYLDHRQRITQTIEDYIEKLPTSDGTVTTFQWIGFGFLLLLILFLISAFFAFDTLSSSRSAQLCFLSALCAGFAGLFFTGGAIFNAEWTGSAGKVGVSGTAGCALFMIVFYGYRKFFPDIPNNAGVPDKLAIDIPPHWNFEQVVGVLATVGKAGVVLEGFHQEEKKAKVRPQALEGKSVADLMLALRGLTIPSGAVRKYGVTKKGSSYTLTVR